MTANRVKIIDTLSLSRGIPVFPLARVTSGCSAEEVIDLIDAKSNEQEDRNARYHNIESSITKPKILCQDERKKERPE